MSEQLKNEIFYPAIHESDKQWGINVTTSGFQLIGANHVYPPEGHPQTHHYHYLTGRVLNEFQIVYITRGKAYFSSASHDETILEEGTIFVLFPGEWHTYRPLQETGWEAYWVGFKGEYTNSFLRNEILDKHFPFFPIGYNEEIVAMFQQINEHTKREEPGAQVLLGGIVLHMIGYLFHFRKNEIFPNKAIIPLLNKARVIMREHVCTKLTPEEIAAKLAISYSWFRRTFKEYTGFSPAQYMMQLKIQKAKELLAQTNDSVKQIAGMLNFEPPDYFSVFFKRATGQTPLAYRAMTRTK